MVRRSRSEIQIEDQLRDLPDSLEQAHNSDRADLSEILSMFRLEGNETRSYDIVNEGIHTVGVGAGSSIVC